VYKYTKRNRTVYAAAAAGIPTFCVCEEYECEVSTVPKNACMKPQYNSFVKL